MTPDAKLRCPSCDGTDIRHSFQRGLLDMVMSAWSRSPRRCRRCERRFYVYLAPAGEAGAVAEPPA